MNYVDLSLIEEFKQWLKLSGFSSDSIEAYSRSLKTYCFEQPVSAVNDKKFFIDLREKLKMSNAKVGTISRHIFAIKKFLVFLSEEKGVSIINIFAIKCKKSPKPNPVYLEKDEIQKIRKIPARSKTQLRDRALFEFLLLTGCRISEAMHTDWHDIDFATNEVTVTGKGDKARIVFLGNSSEWIQRYLKRRANTALPLFLSQYGRRMDRAAAGVAIRKLGKKANLEKDIYPHMLRTTFATHMIRAGVDPRTLQEMLGHEDIETTLRHYVGVSHNQMRTVHARYAKAF